MVFGGTVNTYGRGRAVVTATGMDTEFGKIARMLADVTEDQTPLEARMASIGRFLSVICDGGRGRLILGVFRGHAWLEMLIWGISLAVAAVPESLPRWSPGPWPSAPPAWPGRTPLSSACRRWRPWAAPRYLHRQDRHPDQERNDGPAPFLDGEVVEVRARGMSLRGRFRSAAPS